MRSSCFMAFDNKNSRKSGLMYSRSESVSIIVASRLRMLAGRLADSTSCGRNRLLGGDCLAALDGARWLETAVRAELPYCIRRSAKCSEAGYRRADFGVQLSDGVGAAEAASAALSRSRLLLVQSSRFVTRSHRAASADPVAAGRSTTSSGSNHGWALRKDAAGSSPGHRKSASVFGLG